MLKQDIELTYSAEKSLLGAILMSGSQEVIGAARHKIKPEDFLDSIRSDNLHTRIYKAMLNCPQPFTLAVALEMNHQETLKPGDCRYMCQLIADALEFRTYPDWESAISIIAQESIKRKGGLRVSSYKGIDTQ